MAATPLEKLHALAAAQDGVVTTQQAVASGLTRSHVRTLVARGSWAAVRRGVLAPTELLRRDPVLVACAAKRLRLAHSAVVSHGSAWALHELPYLDAPLEPTLTTPWGAAPERTGVRSALLPASHRCLLGRLPLTSRARTVVDVLRDTSDPVEVQGLADGALRSGVRPADVTDVMRYCEGWPGARLARSAWEGADRLAESPLESRDRLWFLRAGLPQPELQVAVRSANGRLIGRVDFLFRAQRTVVESDGKVKYGDPDALWKEKRREDRLRDTGLEVVRSVWADQEDELVARVLCAFERASRRR